MYAQFWGLTSLPFENTPDPNNFLEAEQHMAVAGDMRPPVDNDDFTARVTGQFLRHYSAGKARADYKVIGFFRHCARPCG